MRNSVSIVEGRELGNTLAALLKQLKKEMLNEASSLPEFADLSSGSTNRLIEFYDGRIGVLVPIVKRLIEKAVRRAYGRALRQLPTAYAQAGLTHIDEEQVTALASAWLSKFQSLTDDMRGDIRNILADAQKPTSNPREIKSRIRDVFLRNNTARKIEKSDTTKAEIRGLRAEHAAQSMARTLTTEAYNNAHLTRYARDGNVAGKEWATGFDERVCPICSKLDTKVVKLNEEFHVTYKGKTYRAQTPPIHHQCRCRILPVTKAQMRRR